MAPGAYIKLLERRVHNQRARLRQLEDFKHAQLRSIWARLYLQWRTENREKYVNACKNLSREAMKMRDE